MAYFQLGEVLPWLN